MGLRGSWTVWWERQISVQQRVRFQPEKSILLVVKLPGRETFSLRREGNFPCLQGDDARPIQRRYWPALSLVN